MTHLFSYVAKIGGEGLVHFSVCDIELKYG